MSVFICQHLIECLHKVLHLHHLQDHHLAVCPPVLLLFLRYVPTNIAIAISFIGADGSRCPLLSMPKLTKWLNTRTPAMATRQRPQAGPRSTPIRPFPMQQYR